MSPQRVPNPLPNILYGFLFLQLIRYIIAVGFADSVSTRCQSSLYHCLIALYLPSFYGVHAALCNTACTNGVDGRSI